MSEKKNRLLSDETKRGGFEKEKKKPERATITIDDLELHTNNDITITYTILTYNFSL